VPIPDEQAARGGAIEAAILTALREMEERGVGGSAATPFLLGRVAELTGGASLEANVALVKNNARFGAEVAKELARQTARVGGAAMDE